MELIRRYFQKISNEQLTVVAILLCIPAFFLNLGNLAFIGDEGIRTLVALEMKLSGHYLVPTLNGEAYYNKPPLYNWLILAMSIMFGHFGEWPTRLTTIFFLCLFALTVYFYSRKHFDRLTSVSLAFMLLTSGRILFWDSMLGLIDICFSWVIFLNFMILYHLGKAGRWKSMFVLSYFLCSIAFLLKGLPAAVFQALSLVTTLFFFRVFRKKIFSAHHFIGIGMGLLPVMTYYLTYASQVSLEKVFSILLDQSVQRTVVHHGILKTLAHIFTFPVEQSYHFIPWSLLIATFFHPRFRQWIQNNAFVYFCFWMLAVNLPVYWLSVEVYPRYLLMFLPLFNVIGMYLLMRTKDKSQQWWRMFQYLFSLLPAMATIAILVMPLHAKVIALNGIIPVWIIGSIMSIICFFGILFDPGKMFMWLILALLVTRSVFNMVILPLRGHGFAENICREDARRLAQSHGDKTWYVYGQTEMHEVARYYTSDYTQQVIHKAYDIPDSTAYYLVDLCLYPGFCGKQVDSLLLERGQIISLMKADHD
ncbi:MAG: hypothetical protein ABIQ02_13140 [Saprospiraceae bacterium]